LREGNDLDSFNTGLLASLLVLLGFLDCFITVVGTVFFGANELNPLMSELVKNNLALFVSSKLTVTTFASLIFVQTDRVIIKSRSKTGEGLEYAGTVLKILLFSLVFVLAILLVNNLVVIIQSFNL
jgi:hypothetical protein